MEGTDWDARWLLRYAEGVPRQLAYPEKTLDGLFADAVRRRGSGAALVFLGAKMSWRALGRLASAWAAALQRMGVRPGDRVALALPNSPQMVAGIFGTLLARAVVVPVNPLYVERELEVVLRDAGARVVLALDRLQPRLGRLRDRLPEMEIVYTHITDPLTGLKGRLAPRIARRGGNWLDVPGERLWKDVLVKGAEVLPGGSPGDLAVLQYTGGTTGVPKGVMLTHRNLVVNAVQTHVWSRAGGAGADSIMAVLPLFHVYGLTVALNAAVVSGSTVILMPRFQVGELVRALERYRPKRFPGTPTMYAAVIQEARRRKVDLSFIEACISGSAPLPLEIQTAFEETTGAWLVEGYGLTEASPVTHCNPLSEKRKNGTIGVPFPDTQAMLVDEEGRVLGPDDGPGELWVKGPQVMLGYWRRPEETGEVLTADGWLKTGDVGTVDEDGHFRIVDRKKDVIIAGGFNVYPREVEEVLYGHPAVLEAAVLGVPDPYRGQSVKAVVVLREGADVADEDLRAHCLERLARYKVPRLWEFRPSLPKSAIGKTLRRVLLEEHLKKAEDVPPV